MALSLGHFIALASCAAWQSYSICIFEKKMFGFILSLKMILHMYPISNIGNREIEIYGVSESGKQAVPFAMQPEALLYIVWFSNRILPT